MNLAVCQICGSWKSAVDITFKVCRITTLSHLSLYIVGDRLINEYGAIGAMRIEKGNRNTRRKTARAPLGSS
jgi:hypothetical protein